MRLLLVFLLAIMALLATNFAEFTTVTISSSSPPLITQIPLLSATEDTNPPVLPMATVTSARVKSSLGRRAALPVETPDPDDQQDTPLWIKLLGGVCVALMFFATERLFVWSYRYLGLGDE
ncbi:uncharacterized protein PAC_01264 [Phialocephala subalpina]|uniref:Uncharacterized protein n=1 Tax=Phialocephala subalpina TaxID=576137 RepID=A0A1L7WF75_9HELO|nr:uncharacterized protein PAC_01264 [Phialocephala subalpina]